MKQAPRGYTSQTSRQMIETGEILDHRGATIFDLSGIPDETDHVERVGLALNKILEYFDSQKDSDELRLLIVVEEVRARPDISKRIS